MKIAVRCNIADTDLDVGLCIGLTSRQRISGNTTAPLAKTLTNSLDRNAITIAVLGGIEKDLHMTDVQYRTCLSILFVGYILGQIPSSMASALR